MTDVLQLLPPFSWRGNKYPVLAREVSFEHEGVRHRIQYRDGLILDQLGAQGLTFSYTLALRQDIARGPYADLFTKYLPILFSDCYNKVPGELYDPIYGGPYWVGPVSYRETTDNNKRDGTDVAVEFVRTMRDSDADALPPVPSYPALRSAAGQMDEEIGQIEDFEQFVAEEGQTDVLSAIAGSAAQIRRQGGKVAAALDDLAAKMDKVDREVAKTENPQLWGIQDSARNTRDGAIRLKRHGENPAQTVVTVTLNVSRTLSAVAADSGMTLEELLELNPSFVTSPMVPKGSKVRTIKSAKDRR